jgi:hypothetical protein
MFQSNIRPPYLLHKLGAPQDPVPAPLTQREKRLFQTLEEDFCAVKGDAKEQASVVQDFDTKLARVPWLERTQFASYLALLKDEEIRTSYELPPKQRREDAADTTEDADLVRILAAAEALFRDVYALCSDMSLE